MSQDAPRTDLAAKTVLYSMPGTEQVIVRRDEPYRVTESGPLTMDLYYPHGAAPGTRLPALVIVFGYSDIGYPNMLGCRFKEMGMTVSWARLFAASGMVAVVYTNRQPAEDVDAVLQSLRENAARLGIDENRIGLWAGSGNVPLALSLLMQDEREYLKCAALCNGFLLDLDGATGVAEAQKTYRFANPCAGKSVDDVRSDVPLFIVRSGQDQFGGVNESIDNFMPRAVRRNVPVTFVNHAPAPHGFDVFHDSDTTREIVRQILGFMQCHLSAGTPKE
ncbi:MAG TPA: alpha/beta hydrolase [Vicinamibacterales bacterium]|nr:alpha/beta hydrolase [Vicinamibacterales bacterium]